MTDPAWTVTTDGDNIIVTGLNRAWLLGVIRSARASDAARKLTPPAADGSVDPVVARLRDIRIAQGVTQRAVADTLRTRIGRHELGQSTPLVSLLHPWAYLLGHEVILTPRGGA